MNITESAAVNRLLAPDTDPNDRYQAARYLAERANQTLAAGIRPDNIRVWDCLLIGGPTEDDDQS